MLLNLHRTCNSALISFGYMLLKLTFLCLLKECQICYWFLQLLVWSSGAGHCQVSEKCDFDLVLHESYRFKSFQCIAGTLFTCWMVVESIGMSFTLQARGMNGYPYGRLSTWMKRLRYCDNGAKFKKLTKRGYEWFSIGILTVEIRNYLSMNSNFL